MKRLLTLLILLATPTFAAELGDDGLHKTAWMRDTFKDLAEDLEEANAEGKRLVLIFEQRGCIYWTKMHEDVFPDETIAQFIDDNYFVVQLNLHGSTEVTDFDGETLEERQMAQMGDSVYANDAVSARRGGRGRNRAAGGRRADAGRVRQGHNAGYADLGGRETLSYGG